MRTNYVLVDYENVQPEVSYATAEALQRLGDRAEYVKIAGNGPNALDFHIAFYIGHLSAQDPAAYFHIISKDTGFDPLIQHLKARKVFAARAKDVADIPLVKAAGSKTPDERVDLIVAHEDAHRHDQLVVPEEGWRRGSAGRTAADPGPDHGERRSVELSLAGMMA
jgi:hypothetical protein